MKFLFAALLCLGSLNSFAEKEEGKTFEEKKAMMLSGTDERLKHMNELRSCISSAADEAALKACRQKMKEYRKEMKKKWGKKKH